MTVDVHAHIGRTVALGVTHTYSDYLETMRAANIEMAILSPMAGGRQAEGVRDTRRENDAIAEAMRAEPIRFPVGLATVDGSVDCWFDNREAFAGPRPLPSPSTWSEREVTSSTHGPRCSPIERIRRC